MGSIKHEHNIKINELNKTIEELKQKLKDRTFSIETFEDNPKLFMFYTGFQNYELFKVFFEFLGPAVHKLDYWGSKPKNSDSAGSSKRGPKRQMSPEEELFIVLARMRCGLLEQDLAVRCQLSTSHISRICIHGLMCYILIRGLFLFGHPSQPSRKPCQIVLKFLIQAQE